MRAIKLVLTVVAPLAVAIPFSSQAPAQKTSFEVASVKVNRSGLLPSSVSLPGCRFVAINASLRALLQFAFRPPQGPRNYQIEGAPAWIDVDRFDVEAKPEGDTRPRRPQTELQLMIQSLMEDRFQLKAHREIKDLPVFDLVVGRGGSKLKLSAHQTPIVRNEPELVSCEPPPPPPPPGTAPPRSSTGAVLPRGGVRVIAMPGPSSFTLTLTANAMPLSSLIALLQAYAGRPIIDKTDLKGLFDITLQFSLETATTDADSTTGQAIPIPALDPSGPSVFTAIQEQLGLRLEPATGPIEVLVVDSVQKPSEN